MKIQPPKKLRQKFPINVCHAHATLTENMAIMKANSNKQTTSQHFITIQFSMGTYIHPPRAVPVAMEMTCTRTDVVRIPMATRFTSKSSPSTVVYEASANPMLTTGSGEGGGHELVRCSLSLSLPLSLSLVHPPLSRMVTTELRRKKLFGAMSSPSTRRSSKLSRGSSPPCTSSKISTTTTAVGEFSVSVTSLVSKLKSAVTSEYKVKVGLIVHHNTGAPREHNI